MINNGKATLSIYRRCDECGEAMPGIMVASGDRAPRTTCSACGGKSILADEKYEELRRKAARDRPPYDPLGVPRKPVIQYRKPRRGDDDPPSAA